MRWCWFTWSITKLGCSSLFGPWWRMWFSLSYSDSWWNIWPNTRSGEVCTRPTQRPIPICSPSLWTLSFGKKILSSMDDQLIRGMLPSLLRTLSRVTPSVGVVSFWMSGCNVVRFASNVSNQSSSLSVFILEVSQARIATGWGAIQQFSKFFFAKIRSSFELSLIRFSPRFYTSQHFLTSSGSLLIIESI